MRNAVFPTLLFLFILTGLLSCSQSSVNRNKKIIYTVNFNWLEGCETGKGDCLPVILQRGSIDDSIRLVFPSGGTESAVYLFKESRDNPYKEDHKRAGEGKPILDLTRLPDGDYRTQMLSCGLGGGFKVILRTIAN